MLVNYLNFSIAKLEYSNSEMETLSNSKKGYLSIFDNKLRLYQQTKTFILYTYELRTKPDMLKRK